ncbi:hypothetical protein [Devriesea agamarum]|uniref:hypothetical protein n=1 Tax=Devriesea agamarum TaxID=472569 RepID=UPI00155E4C5B|nr:hypothetical protein [Devriesea agamarum]
MNVAIHRKEPLRVQRRTRLELSRPLDAPDAFGVTDASGTFSARDMLAALARLDATDAPAHFDTPAPRGCLDALAL